MSALESSSLPEEHLTLAEFARRSGTHPNTVRKFIREGAIEYLVEDTVLGCVVPPGSPKPSKFRYLLPRSAVQQVVANVNPSVKRVSNVTRGASVEATAGTSQNADGDITMLRQDIARLEAENVLLKKHNAFLENITDRLLPQLPPARNMELSTAARPWWRRLFGGRG